MQSLSEINVAREENSLGVDDRPFAQANGYGGLSSSLGKCKNTMDYRDLDEEDQECLDSLHPQIPITPIGKFSDCDGGAGSRDAREEIDWLGEDSDLCESSI